MILRPYVHHHIQNARKIPVCWISSAEHKQNITSCYILLNIPNDSDQETIRQAFLDLAKKYHPDSGSLEADPVKFQEIEKAFRTLNREKIKEQNSKAMEDDLTFDIKHTALQHRQYLSYEGVGFGTPSQRQRQYTKMRATNAATNVMEHRISKSVASEGALLDKNQQKHKHDIKTRYGFDRLVEDLIQEAMSKGEFNNLKGSGKPLSQNRNMNPYVDFVTHKINQILIENGFTPEWIMLQKDIKQDIADLRSKLQSKRNQFGPTLSSTDETEFSEYVNGFSPVAKTINTKINKFNLVVPLAQKQMFNIIIEKEAKLILNIGKTETCIDAEKPKAENINVSSRPESFLGTMFSLFK